MYAKPAVKAAKNAPNANHMRPIEARLGGDEFALIGEFGCDSSRIARAAIKLANRIIKTVSGRIFAGETRVEIGVSIGAACCATDGSNADELLRAADIAMYRAKQEGRGTDRQSSQRSRCTHHPRRHLAGVKRAQSD